MTVAKGIRIPDITCSTVRFKEPLSLYKTDVLELDFELRKARVVNRAGKVKAITSFVAEPNGTPITAGS